MKYKRALFFSIFSYTSVFILGVALGHFINPSTMLLTYSAVIVTLFAAGIFSWLYFYSPFIKSSMWEGVVFAAIMIVTNFVLDFIVIFPATMSFSETYISISHFYMRPYFWATLLGIFVICGLVGWGLGRKKVIASVI